MFRSGRWFITRCDACGILECYKRWLAVFLTLRQYCVTPEKSVHAVYKGSKPQKCTAVIFLFRVALPELKEIL